MASPPGEQAEVLAAFLCSKGTTECEEEYHQEGDSTYQYNNLKDDDDDDDDADDQSLLISLIAAS